MKNEIVKGLAAGGIVGLGLGIPVAIVGWGAVVYACGSIGVGLATTAGAGSFVSAVGGIVGGGLGIAYVAAPTALALFYGVIGATSAAGTAIGAGYGLLKKGAARIGNAFKGMKRTSEPELKESEYLKNELRNSNKTSFSTEISLQTEFENTLKPNNPRQEPPKNRKKPDNPKYK